MSTSNCATAASRTRTTLGSGRTTSGTSTGAADVACTKVAAASRSGVPGEVASTVNERETSWPAAGGGASIRSRAVPTSPASTSSDGGEKAKWTMRSGSRPPRNTRRVRRPPRLSTTTSTRPLSPSRTRTKVGSTRIVIGASSVAVCIKVALAVTCSSPSDRGDRQLPGRGLAGIGGGRLQPDRGAAVSPAGTSSTPGVKMNRTTPSGSRPLSVTRRAWLPMPLSMIACS